MIWFFAFTSLGFAVILTLLAIRRSLSLRWYEWVGGITSLSVFAWLAQAQAKFE